MLANGAFFVGNFKNGVVGSLPSDHMPLATGRKEWPWQTIPRNQKAEAKPAPAENSQYMPG